MKTKTEIATATATAIETAAAPTAEAPRTKKLHLLVDNLTHVSDHGLKVEFTDPALIEWVKGIAAADNCVLKFKAGLNSTLKITRRGDVTKTEFSPSRGYGATNIHYYCPKTKAAYKVQSSDCWAFDQLNATIFGELFHTASRQVTPVHGYCQDTLREHLKKKAWALLGESGLRAKAYHASVVAPLDKQLEDVKSAATYAEQDLKMLETRDYEGQLKKLKGNLATLPSQLAARVKFLEGLKDKKKGEEYDWDARAAVDMDRYFQPSKDGGRYVSCFYGTPEGWSHPAASVNYTVKLSLDGKDFILSSGIKCPVTPDAALSWLRGEAPAPNTVYGTVRREECRDKDNKPSVVVACGCHRLDLTELGGEFAKLLTPKHKVVELAAKPQLDFGGKTHKGFMSELRRRIVAAVRVAQENHDQQRQTLIQVRASLKKEMKGRPAVIAAAKAKVEVAKKAVVAVQMRVQDAARADGFVGIRLEDANKLGVAICNSLVGIKAGQAE